MADVIPFKGILYNPEKIDDLSRVMAPPYDVISSEMQEELYRIDQHNIIRLILGKELGNDTAANNRYIRAQNEFNNWADKDILKKDKNPSLYIYQQKYLHKGSIKVRTGFIGLMKIEDPRKSQVLPHEYTLKGPKKDRLKLMNKVKANLSPIFSLFEDENSFVTNILLKAEKKSSPLIDIDLDGVSHKLWRIKDASSIKRITRFMKSKAIFIADGHHRYETALAFRNQMLNKKGNKKSFNYIMVYFSNLNQEAITILSTHRVIKDIANLTPTKLLSRLKGFFEIKKVKTRKGLLKGLDRTKEGCFGLYCGRGNFYLLTLKRGVSLDKLIAPGKSASWKRLPVTILHELILNRALRLKEKLANEDNIIYTKDADYAINLVDKENYKAAFFLNPTSVDQLKDVAQSRSRMPRKSTYFYPKLLSGLVINKF